MVKIIKDGETLTVTEHPVWVKLQSNGYYATCSQEDAVGITVDEKVYEIGADVSISEVDAGAIVFSLTTELVFAQQEITDRELDAIALGQQMTDLELVVLGGGVNV